MLLLGIDLGTFFDQGHPWWMPVRRYAWLPPNSGSGSGDPFPKPGWSRKKIRGLVENVQQTILKCHSTGAYDPASIAAIGIAYQMHGLVMVDKDKRFSATPSSGAAIAGR